MQMTISSLGGGNVMVLLKQYDGHLISSKHNVEFEIMPIKWLSVISQLPELDNYYLGGHIRC